MPKGPFTSHGRQSTLRTQVGARDARTGLGYGVLEPKTQLPRSMGSIYPYYEKDELDPTLKLQFRDLERPGWI